MFSLNKARRKLERWLLGSQETVAPRPAKPAADTHDLATPISLEARIRAFMDALGATPQEWLGRVRLLSLDSIRETLGPKWPRLNGQVETLAERVIEAELCSRDRHLNMGFGEFLVFFADATPEESRFRCLAIVQTIHEKLFCNHSDLDCVQPVARCDLIHRAEIPYALAGARCSTLPDFPDAAGPESLDSRDLLRSSQVAIDAILNKALEARDHAELEALLVRLKHLCRSLKRLEPVLALRNSATPGVDRLAEGRQEQPGCSEDSERAQLAIAWQDIVELISVLNTEAERSLPDRLNALSRLQEIRAEKLPTAVSPQVSAIDRQFGYLPFFRSIQTGERIMQGIYRVEPPTAARNGQLAIREVLEADLDWREYIMRVERATLAHAIDTLTAQGENARFILMASVQVDTLRGPHCRYSTILRSAQERVKQRLLIEVAGYRESDNTVGIRRAVSELRAHCRGILVTIDPESWNIERVALQCKTFGAHAIGIDVSRYRERKTAILGGLAGLSRAGEQQSTPWFVSGISNVDVLAKAIASGAAYVSAPSLRPAVSTPGEMKRVTLDDLYVAV